MSPTAPTSPPIVEPGCAVTGIGSLPHVEPARGVAGVLTWCPEYPYWPQFPRASRREDMYRQYSAGLPGLIDDPEAGTPHWRRDQAALTALERVYADTLALESGPGRDADTRLAGWALTPDDARGLYALADALRAGEVAPPAGLKGQITGPVSLGLTVTDEHGRALLYQEDLMDGVVRALILRARWLVRFMRGLLDRFTSAPGGAGPGTVLLSVDEPSLGTFGSAYFPYSPETVLSYLQAFDDGVDACWGVHCCANTDWEFILASPVRFLSFDAFAYGQRLSLYPAGVRRFLAEGRILAWGIVPTDARALSEATAQTLSRQLLDLFERLSARGVSERALARQSIITPACGLAGLTPEEAERAMALTRGVSDILRSTFLPHLDNLDRGDQNDG